MKGFLAVCLLGAVIQLVLAKQSVRTATDDEATVETVFDNEEAMQGRYHSRRTDRQATANVGISGTGGGGNNGGTGGSASGGDITGMSSNLGDTASIISQASNVEDNSGIVDIDNNASDTVEDDEERGGLPNWNSNWGNWGNSGAPGNWGQWGHWGAPSNWGQWGHWGAPSNWGQWGHWGTPSNWGQWGGRPWGWGWGGNQWQLINWYRQLYQQIQRRNCYAQCDRNTWWH